MFNIGTPELLMILAIALIVVGPKRLPEIGRTVGRVVNELRKVQDEVRDMVRFDLSDDTSVVPDTKPVPAPHQVRDLDGPGGEPVANYEPLGIVELAGRDETSEAGHGDGSGTGVPQGDTAAE